MNYPSWTSTRSGTGAGRGTSSRIVDRRGIAGQSGDPTTAHRSRRRLQPGQRCRLGRPGERASGTRAAARRLLRQGAFELFDHSLGRVLRRTLSQWRPVRGLHGRRVPSTCDTESPTTTCNPRVNHLGPGGGVPRVSRDQRWALARTATPSHLTPVTPEVVVKFPGSAFSLINPDAGIACAWSPTPRWAFRRRRGWPRDRGRRGA